MSRLKKEHQSIIIWIVLGLFFVVFLSVRDLSVFSKTDFQEQLFPNDKCSLALTAYLQGEPVARQDAWWLDYLENYDGGYLLMAKLQKWYLPVINQTLGKNLTPENFGGWWQKEGRNIFQRDFELKRVMPIILAQPVSP